MCDHATSVNTINLPTCEVRTTPAFGSALRSMDINLHRLHHPATRITGKNPDNGSRRPVYKDGTLHRP